jgi:4-amino-4-deoxy-L-arabinose transferase-like glycosyltransferase
MELEHSDTYTKELHNSRTGFAWVNIRPIFYGFIAIGLLLVVTIHLINLTKYPPVMLDESWSANCDWNFLTTGKNLDKIHDGVPSLIHEGFTTFNFIGRIPYIASFSVLGLGLFQARLPSFVFSLILLGALFFVGCKSYQTLTGLIATLLLALSAPFVKSAHWARQDIVLAAIVMISYGLALIAFEKEKWWAHFLAGLLLSVSLDVHENAGMFIPGLVILYLIKYKTHILRMRGTWFAAAGGVLGIIIFILVRIIPNPEAYFALNKYRYANVHLMPLIELSLMSILRSMDHEIGRYHFYEYSLDFALIGASFVYLGLRRKKPDQYLLAFTSSAFVCFVLFQGNKADYYAILFYPFFMLAVAESFTSLIFNVRTEKIRSAFYVVVLVLFLFNSSIHFLRLIYQSRDYSYEAISDQIKSAIPTGARVLGSPTWWLGLAETDYSSYKVLQYLNYYEAYSLNDGLLAVHPEFIVIDPVLELQLFTGNEDDLEPKFSYQEFEQFLNQRGTKLLEFDTPGHGPIQIYEINWGD